MLNVFYFEIDHIKGNENKVVDVLSRRIQVNHLASVSWYETNIE